MLTELEIQTFEDNKYTVCIYITSLWILNDVISNMISTHLHLLKVNERIQLLSANLHYASYHPLHFTVHRNTKEGERTSIFKLHYYIIVDTIVWIICEAKQYSEDRDESALDIVSIMKVSHPSSCIMQGIVLLWSSSSSWVFTKFDHIITRIRCSEDDIQYRLISTFRYTFLFLLFLYIMDGWIYICYSIFFFWLREQPYKS